MLTKSKINKQMKIIKSLYNGIHTPRYQIGYEDALKWVLENMQPGIESALLNRYTNAIDKIIIDETPYHEYAWELFRVKNDLHEGTQPIAFAQGVLQAVRSWYRIGNCEEINKRFRVLDEIMSCFN